MSAPTKEIKFLAVARRGDKAAAGGDWLTEFWVPYRSELLRIAAGDIDRIDAERDYVRLHVGQKDGTTRSYLLLQTVSGLEARLDPDRFIRLHRSTILRRDRIKTAADFAGKRIGVPEYQITAVVWMRGMLQQRNAALEEADAMKTRFLANMSYEFRTPLTSIGGFAELLEAGLGGDLSEQGREYVGAILASVGRLGEQIESVLDLSQSEAGMLPLAQEDIELLPFVTRLVEERAARIKDGGLSLDLRGDKSAGRITGDKRRLARAIGHLLDNAVSATPTGGRILVELGAHKGRSRIVISDNGPGMDGPTLARALEGIKLSADGRSIERRQGIGLPLARQLIEAHGGTLELISESGQGTAAIVDLP